MNEDLEKPVRSVFEGGVVGLNAAAQSAIVPWAAKVFLGLIVKETLLDNNRATPGSAIRESRTLNRFELIRLIASSVLAPIRFSDRVATVNVFKTQMPHDGRLGSDTFHYSSDMTAGVLSIFAPPIGLIVSFDFGLSLQSENAGLLHEARGLSLHPVQWAEINALAEALAYGRTGDRRFTVIDDTVNLGRWITDGGPPRCILNEGQFRQFFKEKLQFELTGRDQLDFSQMEPPPTFLKDSTGNLRHIAWRN